MPEGSGMTTTWLPIAVFVSLMAGMPLLLGLLCRRIMGSASSPARGLWTTLAQLLTLLGWGTALALGKLGFMGYPASVLLGSVLYAPGLFIWGYHIRQRAGA